MQAKEMRQYWFERTVDYGKILVAYQTWREAAIWEWRIHALGKKCERQSTEPVRF